MLRIFVNGFLLLESNIQPSIAKRLHFSQSTVQWIRSWCTRAKHSVKIISINDCCKAIDLLAVIHCAFIFVLLFLNSFSVAPAVQFCIGIDVKGQPEIPNNHMWMCVCMCVWWSMIIWDIVVHRKVRSEPSEWQKERMGRRRYETVSICLLLRQRK